MCNFLYFCIMNMTFNYSIVIEPKEGQTESTKIQAGVFLREIVNYALEEDTLYLFLNRDIEDVKPKNVPVKTKVTKENPRGWSLETQMRSVTEPYTITVSEKEDIERFMAYVTSQQI